MGLGEKKQVVIKYNSQGLALGKALKIANVTKAQYYHQKRTGKPGTKPSVTTKLHKGSVVMEENNTKVVEKIKLIQNDRDTRYGYKTMSKALQQIGYEINHKKVYRLMHENQLLNTKKIFGNKNYVKHRKVQPLRPLHILEMDIKMVWIEREKKHAFVLNIIDTFSRKWLYQCASFSIKKEQVKKAWEYIIEHHLQPNNMLEEPLHIEVRNDNDKRFSAKLVQDFFKENHLKQVFTHPYTPQENGHVESFHSILGQHLKPYHFWTILELEQNLLLFQAKYNNVRLHSSIAHLSPCNFEALWHLNLIAHTCTLNKRRTVFKLKIPHYKIKHYTGNIEQEVGFSLEFEPVDLVKIQKQRSVLTSITPTTYGTKNRRRLLLAEQK